MSASKENRKDKNAVPDLSEPALTKDQGKSLQEGEEKARQQLAEIQAIYDTARIGLTVLDRDLRYVRINQRLAEMNGLPASEHVGKTVEQVVPSMAPAIREIAERIFITGIGVTDVEFSGSLPSAPGVQRTWLEQWMPIKDASGTVIALNVAIEEITNRKKYEQDIRALMNSIQQEKDRLSAVINSIPDEVWFADSHKNFTLANPSALREFGLGSIDKLDIEAFARSMEVFRPDGSPRPVEEAPPLRALEGQTIHNQEEIIRTPVTGELRYREVNAVPVIGSTGDIHGSVSVVRDITERKKAEEALRKYELLAANTHDTILFLNYTDGQILEANKAAIAAYGYSRDELLTKKIADLRAKETQSLVEQQLAKANSQGAVFETYHLRRDGTPFPVEVSSQGLDFNGQRTLISVIRDISERKRVENELTILSSFPLENPNPVLRASDRSILLYANPASADILNCWHIGIGEELPDNISIIVSTVMNSGKSKQTELDCGGRIYDFVIAPIVKSGHVNLYLRDITGRKQAEKDLKGSEERLRLAIEAADFGTWDLDLVTGKAVRSLRHDQIFGYQEAQTEWSVEIALRHILPEDRDNVQLAHTPAPGKETMYIEARMRRADGSIGWVMSTGRFIFDENGRPVRLVGVCADISERKKVQEVLAAAKEHLEELVENRTQELWAQVETTKRAEADLRSLSAKMIVAQEEERRTIAKELHDEVGQTLTVLKLMAGSLNKTIPEELKPRLEAINKELTDVMMRVRLMSQTLRPTVLDDLGLVPGLEWLFARLKEQAGLQIEFDCPKLENLDQKVSVTVYRIIQESLTNVMRHSGVKSAFVHISFDEKHLMVRVTDYGRGFNNNEVHTSTGLSAMRERAKLLDGKVEVKSEPGKGTVVTLRIPLKPSETRV